MSSERCLMCGDLGWVLDCNDLGKPGPRMVEFIPCFYPECGVSGQPVQSVAFKGVRFGRVSVHPRGAFVMSVSNPTCPDEVAAAVAELADEVIRVDGGVLCPHCGEPYESHPWDDRQTYRGEPYLRVGCDGRRLKL